MTGAFADHIKLPFKVIGEPRTYRGVRAVPARSYETVKTLGMAGAKKAADDLHREALTALESFDAGADALRWLANYIVNRDK